MAGWYQVQSVRLHFNSIKVRLEYKTMGDVHRQK